MDFSKLKEKAKHYSKQAKEKLDAGIDSSIKKFGESSFVISEKKELEEIINASKNYTNSYGKIARRRTIVIFAEKDSDFYKHILTYIAPVMFVKAWTQNVKMKLSNIDIAELAVYGVDESPSLLVFEDTKVVKVLGGRERVEKVVKNLNVDINYLIDNL